jgi:small subunit ribosomal protein S2
MAEAITVRTLLEAGVHFGHQTRRWNPKMKPYIFTSRGDIYILDLKQTLLEMDKAYSFVKNISAKGGSLLFVGTKKQAQESIGSAAERCGMPFVNHRWLGGMLTNLQTIKERIFRMQELETMIEDGRMDLLPKKEQQILKKELGKLQANLNGIRSMSALPSAVFIVDTKREEIAVREANKLGIPVIGMLDTNADPDEVEFGIPSNDDAIRSVDLMCQLMADAVLAGKGDDITAEDMVEAVPPAEDAPVVAEEPVAAEAEPAAEDAPAEPAVD